MSGVFAEVDSSTFLAARPAHTVRLVSARTDHAASDIQVADAPPGAELPPSKGGAQLVHTAELRREKGSLPYAVT